MLLQCKKEQIIEGLHKAASIIPSKNGAAYLRSLWIKGDGDMMTIMGTDTNLEFTGTYPAKVSHPGMVGVNGRRFVDLISRLPGGDLTLKLEENASTLSVEQGRRKYALPINDVTWFQNLAEFPAGQGIAWSGDFFKESLEKTLFCCADDESADSLACLYIGRDPGGKKGIIHICGLDGHQFAIVDITHDDLAEALPENGVLLQKKYVNELGRWLPDGDIELSFTDKRIFIRTADGAESLSLPRSGYEYPDYTAFMSRLDISESSVLTLNRRACMESLDRLALFNSANETCAVFELSPSELSLSAAGQETGKGNETLDVSYKGDLKSIVFPTRDLINIMSHFSSETLTIKMTENYGPCSISGNSDPGYMTILMPMKISQEEYYTDEEQ